MIKYAIVGVAIVALFSAGALWLKNYHDNAVADGIQKQKTIDLTVATKLVKERDELKTTDRTATNADICNRLHGKWVRVDNDWQCN